MIDNSLESFYAGELYIDISGTIKEQMEELYQAVKVRWMSGQKLFEWWPKVFENRIYIHCNPNEDNRMTYTRVPPTKQIMTINDFLNSLNFVQDINEDEFSNLFDQEK